MSADQFFEIDPYVPGTNEFSCANYSSDQWKVTFENGKIQISAATNVSLITLDVAGGKMIAQNEGEFGGGLEFSEKKSQKIFAKNISFLFSLPNSKVAAFGGLDHMRFDDGYMLVIGRQSETADWKIEKQIKLPANPYAVTAKDGNFFYFVTSEGLHSIDWPTGKIEKLKAASSKGLYPNSIVVANNGHIYVGMRYAVAHFIPEKSGFKVKWLVKNRCEGKKVIDGVQQ